MKFRFQHILLAFVLLCITYFTSLSVRLRSNVAYVLITTAYTGRFSSNTSLNLIKQAWLVVCKEQTLSPCKPETRQSDEDILMAVDRHFVYRLSPIQFVSDTTIIPINRFLQYDLPTSLQTVESPGILYGPGYFQLRIFLMSNSENCWQFAVKAKHDDPPPVKLEIWLDNTQIGALLYDKGDQSWEILSIYSSVDPNTHSLQIRFANDFFDRDAGLDRNAYIEYVKIGFSEASNCENN